MKTSIAVAAALVLSSLAFTPGTAAARGAGHGPVSMAPSGHSIIHPQPVSSGKHSDYGWGYGRGWCYWHPYSCSGTHHF